MSALENGESLCNSRKLTIYNDTREFSDDEDSFTSAVGSPTKESILQRSDLPSCDDANDSTNENSKNSEYDDQGLSMFSMSKVSQKLIDMVVSAKERMWGEDHWVPTDPTTVVVCPYDALSSYQRIWPEFDDDHENMFGVYRRSDDETALFHVTFAIGSDPNQTHYLSIFRSKDVQEATDLCESCMLCKELFVPLKIQNAYEIKALLIKIKHHPLWQAVHIAARMGNVDFFVEQQKMGEDHMERLLSTVSHPEGLYPLMIAIRGNMVNLVDYLMSIGADPSVTDVNGSNAMHFASLASSQMLETLWKYNTTHELLNQANSDGCTPLFLAIRHAGPLCISTLVHFGAALNVRWQGNSPLFEAMQSRGTTISVLQSLLKASPDSVHERGEQTGNSLLHVALFKQPLVALLQLCRGKIDVSAVNYVGQSALHVNAHRGNLECVFTLAANGINLDLQDNNGDTGLHIAVSKSNVIMTRALLCLGAKTNIKNRHGDTPRHLAAKLPSADMRKVLVYSLMICGAERCGAEKMGCRSGCVNKRSKLGQIHSAGSFDMLDVDDEALEESTAGTRVSSVDEEFIQDLMGKEPAIKDAPTHDFRQRLCYEAVHKRAQKVLAEGGHESTRMINLISFDGGGIRGLVTIQILLALEKMLGEPVFDYFDWVAGTSTGSYVAGGLAQGKSLRDCQHIYLRFKDTIFESWSRVYNTEAVEAFMQSELGAELTLGDVHWPRLMISTVRCDVFPVKLEFFRNYRLPVSEKENEKLGFFPPSEVKLWKALRCSSAAPTFFSSVDSKYIDGGLIANNPAIDLLAEVHLWNTALQYTDQPDTDQLTMGCLLSIGTGVLEPVPMSMLDLNLSLVGNPFSVAAAMKNLGVILIDQVTATEGQPVSRSRSWAHSLGVPYFRLCPPLSKDVELDTKNDAEIAQMMWETMEYTFTHRKEMVELVELLRLLGKSEHRRHLFTAVDTGARDMQTQTSVNFGLTAEDKPIFTAS